MTRALVVVLVAGLLPAVLGAAVDRAAAQVADPVTRAAGADRIGTAVAVSASAWERSATVLLASAANFPDALAGGALASALDAPLLLTDPAALSPEAAGEIARLGAERVVILGGEQAVGPAVADALSAAGLTVQRAAGEDRYATAAVIAALAAPGGAPEAVVASGEGFADALAAGALAATSGTPTLLTAAGDLPEATAKALADLGAERVLLLGGVAAVGQGVEDALAAAGYDVERLGGADRYGTAALVAGEALTRTGAEPLPAVLATGEDFPDALAAAALAARVDGLLVPVPRGPLAGAPPVRRLLALGGPRFTSGVIVGGPAAVSDEEGIAAALRGGPLARTATAEGAPGAGAAATVEPLATQAALDVLGSGGNAVDATIAAAGVLGVVEPFSAGIGGGGFLVLYDAPSGRVVTFDSREEAPAAYFPEVFLDPATGEPIPFPERVTSGLGVGVPGTVDGWDLVSERYGTRPLAELLQPGIDAAAYGFPVDETFATQVEANAERFAAFSSTAELYLPDGGRGRPAGGWFRNPDLAATYRLLAERGSRSFYDGPVAQAIVDTVQAPPLVEGETLTVRPGLMELGDLSRYQALVREPVRAAYRDVEVVGMGLPSSGGLTIALALNQLERFEPLGTDREEALHRYLESIHLAWADRNAYMGDPAYVDAPVEGLLSQDYADERSALLTETATTAPREPGDPFAYQDDPSPSEPPGGSVEAARVGSTTHLTVSDAAGSVVSYTFTIEQIGGSGIVVPGHGFLLNNELTDFDPVPPHPNAPEGGKRPRSSMSPTIVLRDGEPVLALGSPGGATIITTVLQQLVDVLDVGVTLPEALAAPRVANFNAPTSTAEEAFLATPEAAALQARGHVFTATPEIGAAAGIAFAPDGSVTAAAEPVRRGAGDAGVVPPPNTP